MRLRGRDRMLLMWAAVWLMSGCTALKAVPGIAAGVTASAVTSNPLVGLAAATAADAALDAGLKYVSRRFSQAEQQQIADAVGNTAPGMERIWSVNQPIPYMDSRGKVIVLNEQENALTVCREALFSVEGGNSSAPTQTWYTLSVCRNGNIWQWAQAEPATARWGALQ